MQSIYAIPFPYPDADVCYAIFFFGVFAKVNRYSHHRKTPGWEEIGSYAPYLLAMDFPIICNLLFTITVNHRLQ